MPDRTVPWYAAANNRRSAPSNEWLAKRVAGVFGNEGMPLVSGEVLVQPDAEVEQRALRIAQAAVEEARARLFVEVFWLNRVRPGDRFTVRDAGTPAPIGEGHVAEVLPYVGSRGFPV